VEEVLDSDEEMAQAAIPTTSMPMPGAPVQQLAGPGEPVAMDNAVPAPPAGGRNRKQPKVTGHAPRKAYWVKEDDLAKHKRAIIIHYCRKKCMVAGCREPCWSERGHANFLVCICRQHRNSFDESQPLLLKRVRAFAWKVNCIGARSEPVQAA
jgi:hypothetical protein